MTHLTRGIPAKVLAIVLLLTLIPSIPAGSQQPAPPAGSPPPGSPPPGSAPPGSPPPAGSPEPAAANVFSPDQLEQIVAPIALYPDPLLAQIFMASTYPLEVVQAARFTKDNPSLKDAALSEELKKQDWDDSVKSLVSFPQVLTMMNDKLDWMQKLGDAFLDQQAETMDAVQRLRARAQSSGNLKSTSEQTVSTAPFPADAPPPPPPPAGAPPPPPPPTQIITIEPANPQVVYVPTYNPTVVYGAWPYPAYPPYAYYPPGYMAGTALLSFGVGMAVGGALWGNCNWGGGDVNINNSNYNNFTKNVNNSNRQNQINNRPTQGGGQGGRGQGGWQHSPDHRRGAQYKNSATQQKFNKGGPGNASSREGYRGRDQGRGGSGPQGGQNRPGAGGGGSLGGGGAQTRPAGGAGGGGSFGGGSGAGGGGRQAGAFEGMGQSRDVGAASQRGQSSLNSSRSSGGGGSRSSGGGGGGGGGSRGGGGGGGGGSRGGGRR